MKGYKQGLGLEEEETFKDKAIAFAFTILSLAIFKLFGILGLVIILGFGYFLYFVYKKFKG